MPSSSASNSKPFIELCLDGEKSIDEIDDFVDEWHDSDNKQSLSEFLGMTNDEYALWIEKPEILSDLIHARKH